MKKYFSIELLRFLTSLSVLMYHYRHFFSPLNILSTQNYQITKNSLPFSNYINWLYEYGFFGVHIFYTISGFVFAYVYLKSKQNTSFKEFSINRIARLYPLHFATLLFVAFFQYLYLFNYDSFQFDLFNDFYHFILQLLFISSWGFEDGHSFNAPIWSVSVEIGIYIVFFIFLKQFKKYQLNLSIILTIILILIDKSKFFDTLFLECARLFFSGVLIYFIINRNYNYSKTLIASVVLLILSFVGNFKTFLFCPSIVLFFLSFEKFIVRDRIKSIFSLLGNLTYALYLLHVPFQLLIIFFFDKYLIDMNYFFSLSFFLIYFIILFAISHLIFVFYEKPLNKKIRKSLLNT